MPSLYGFEVKTALPLRRLNRARGERGTLRVEVAEERLREPAGEAAGVLEDERGVRWYASYETGDGCLLVMPPTGAFLLGPEAGRVTVDWRDEDRDLLEHRVASSAICTLLALRGDLSLHASGIEHAGGAVLFCGPTQRGKSSLARTLGERGRRVLGEDGIVVGLDGRRPLAYPGARGVRVRGGGRRPDLVPDPGPGEPSALPLTALVLLRERGKLLEVESLEQARALALLTPNLIHSGGRKAIGAAFGRLATVLSTVPAFAASLPDELAALPEASERLLDAIGAPG